MTIEFCWKPFKFLMMVFPLWPTNMINYVNRVLNIKWLLIVNHPWFPGVKSTRSWWIILPKHSYVRLASVLFSAFISISKIGLELPPSLAIVVRSYQQTHANLTKEIRTHFLFLFLPEHNMGVTFFKMLK